MPLLSICIPTYNRPRELAALMNGFLSRALDTHGDLLEIIVCDNSDDEQAMANAAQLDRRISYRKNDVNLGFAGNLIRCVRAASGTYLWLLSDDDEILWKGFQALMDQLPRAGAEGVAGVMLPFRTRNHYGDEELSNRHVDYGVGRTTSLSKILESGLLPFVLFSSVVVRLDKRQIDELHAKYSKNDYLQIVMLIGMMGGDAKVRFLDEFVIQYTPEYHVRFPILSLAASMAEVRRFLSNDFGFASDDARDYRGWLMWLIHERVGHCRIRDSKHEKPRLMRRLFRHFSFKGLLMCIGLLMPRFVLRFLYVNYRSYQDMRRYGTMSLSEFLDRRRSLKGHIRTVGTT